MASNRYRGRPFPDRDTALLPWKSGEPRIDTPPQPRLFSEPQAPLAEADPARPEPDADSTAPIWLQRISLVVLVLFCLYLGGMVTILPWWPSVWDHNRFLQRTPWLWTLLMRAPVRGLVSGLGLLDIWIGVSEAIHYRDQRP
jgi:hypothetical protein